MLKEFVINRNRILLLLALMAMVCPPSRGQEGDVFRHLSLSAGIGTTGITADLGTMLGSHVGLRGGIDYMPKIKYSTDLTLSLVNQTEVLDISDIPEKKVEVTGTLNNTTGHALLDIYPYEDHGFHITVGAYFGNDGRIVDVTNKENELLKKVAALNARRGDYADIPISYGQIAVTLGEYNIMPNDDGYANAYIQIKKVRPYLGIGFGRAVPSALGLKCLFDVGVQFSGKPHVYNGVNGEELTAEGARGEDGGYLKTISQIHFYPVISVRLAGRLF